MQKKFVANKLNSLLGKHILDIGCASGELGFQLATNGADVIGIDLNEDLLSQAKEKKVHNKLTFQQGNMLELEQDFSAEKFDSVLCFGNTLVHLESEEQVMQMLKATQAVLKLGGQLLLQILNYDYIINDQVSELPLIDTERIQFIRKYKFVEGSKSIRFQTDLRIKAEEITVSNDTALLALRSSDLVQLLENAGFKNIQLYSNFKQDVFGGEHIPLVLSCLK